ncbi:Uncharacterised protein [Shigella sonnei]|nr:Uncharacterised protein [Shigella sonnei]CSG35469.1 Uncharacterised protein [Shigella sonnei]CSP84192.1 Uncharacterised protein [Shigella sonnei]
MPRGVTFFTQRIFQHLQRNATLRRRLHILNININDLIHGGAVKHHRVFHNGFQPTFSGGSAGTRHTVNFVRIHKIQHTGYLLCGTEFYDRCRNRQSINAMNIRKFTKTVNTVLL